MWLLLLLLLMLLLLLLVQQNVCIEGVGTMCTHVCQCCCSPVHNAVDMLQGRGRVASTPSILP